MSGIVVGYVSSPEGEAAIRQGIAEAKLRSCRVVVVYSDPAAQHDSASSADRADELERIHGVLAAAAVEHDVRHIVHVKDPANDVLDTAEETEAELIVIGIRRRSPVGKLILGSHSQSILLEANVPVLAVKA